MHGLQAISAANGWVMALAGALIVMAGLTILSFIISQLHKFVAIFDKPAIDLATMIDTAPASQSKPTAVDVGERDLFRIDEATAAYQPLIEQLQAPFELRSLYALSAEHKFPHVHLTIKSLREAGKLVPRGDGLFTWSPEGAAVVEAVVSPVSVPSPPAPSPSAPAQPTPAAPAVPEPVADTLPAAPSVPASHADGSTITAPMPGMIVRYDKQEGDTVSEGETVVVLEAMKMENALPSPFSGTVTSIRFASGDAVAKGDVLCVIA